MVVSEIVSLKIWRLGYIFVWMALDHFDFVVNDSMLLIHCWNHAAENCPIIKRPFFKTHFAVRGENT
jgi:hypothetical protein